MIRVDVQRLFARIQPWRWILIVAAATVVMLLAAIFFIKKYDQPVNEQPRTTASLVQNDKFSQPVMPRGYQPAIVVRDPFAVPDQQQLAVASQQAAPVRPANVLMQARRPDAAIKRPVLTGIAMGPVGKTAIIEYQGQSRSYVRGEYVGVFEVIEITGQTVVLAGPNARLTLTIKR